MNVMLADRHHPRYLGRPSTSAKGYLGTIDFRRSRAMACGGRLRPRFNPSRSRVVGPPHYDPAAASQDPPGTWLGRLPASPGDVRLRLRTGRTGVHRANRLASNQLLKGWYSTGCAIAAPPPRNPRRPGPLRPPITDPVRVDPEHHGRTSKQLMTPTRAPCVRARPATRRPVPCANWAPGAQTSPS